MDSSTFLKSTISEKQDENDARDADDRALLAPYNYICQMPGKQVRSKLATAFNYWFKIPDENLSKIAEVIQMLHNASLMIDDIEDSSILRRGLPVAHSIYGVPSTINSANYVYFLALEKAAEFGSAEAMKIFTEQLLELHRGQGMEIFWRDMGCCPTEDQYLKMVARKTGGLFNLAVRLMQLFSKNQTDYQPLVESLGIYFQMRDDFANLWASDYSDAKSYCEDLTEGKFSFPIIHAIRSQPNDSRVIIIVRRKTNNVEVKKYCVGLLEEFGSYDYTKARLRELDAKIRQQISDQGGNPYLGPILDELKKIFAN